MAPATTIHSSIQWGRPMPAGKRISKPKVKRVGNSKAQTAMGVPSSSDRYDLANRPSRCAGCVLPFFMTTTEAKSPIAKSDVKSSLRIMPLTFRQAREFVSKMHRHHKPPQGHKFSIGVENESSIIVGVVICGRPVSRMLDDGYTIEITRCCTNGAFNACSILYGAAWRAARAMGYRRAVTYTLKEETGTSLKASGWICNGEAGGGEWSRRKRERRLVDIPAIKLRWEVRSD